MNETPASTQPGQEQPEPGQLGQAQPGLAAQAQQNPAPAPAVAPDSAASSVTGVLPVVEFRHVSIAFDGPPVLVDVSFTVRPGETRILLGPAGVGKSVLLKLTNGLLRPDRGSIRLFGEEITTLPEEQLFPLRARTGMVFQEGALFDSLSVRDNVAFQLIQERVPDEEIDRRVRDALRFVELEETFDLFPASLSGGMRRRVAIARAIIRQPELLLYDSPTGGLDPVTSTTIIELIVKERDAYHIPSLLVTHRLQDAFILSNHRFDPEAGHMALLPQGETDPHTTFLMLAEGRLIFDGSLHELITSQNPFVREFLE
jgi:phospholipid/cholesterol/gamma-HCH transport system ATP-binding protein